MFVKGQKIFADAGHYLQHKTRSVYALSVKGRAEDYVERELNSPLDIEISGGMVFYQDRKLALIPDRMDYASIKTRIVKSLYSNDDQLAIILNRDNSDDDAMLYDKMQEWREWASQTAQLILTSLK